METVAETTDMESEQPVMESWKEDDRTFVFEISQTTEEEAAAVESMPEFKLEPEKPKFDGENFFGEKLRTTEEIKPFEVYIRKTQPEPVSRQENPVEHSATDLRSQERIERLRSMSLKLKNDSAIEELEHQPAYMRRNVDLKNTAPSSESRLSRYSLYDDGEGRSPEIRNGNSFLHDNVD
jgi:hypothetical protein